MDYKQFTSYVRKAHLTVREFARLLKMNRISLSNYSKRAAVPSHLAIIAVLLSEMEGRDVDFRSLLSRIEINCKRPRGAGIGKFGGDRQQRLF